MSKNFVIAHTAVLPLPNGQEFLDPTAKLSFGIDIRFLIWNIENKVKDDSIEIIPDLKEVNGEQIPDFTKTRGLKGSEAFFKLLFDDIKNAHPNKKDTLIFVHGFDTDQNRLRKNLVQFQENYVNNPKSTIGRIVAFHWPSNGMITSKSYKNERIDAELAGVALSRALGLLDDYIEDTNFSSSEGKFHILCHSMGNYVFEFALDSFYTTPIPMRKIFDKILLVASDVSWKVFENGYIFHDLNKFCNNVNVYIHKTDLALKESEKRNGEKRLGRSGPSNIAEILTHNSDLSYITVINCTETKSNSLIDNRDPIIHHWYYYTSEIVVNDIVDSLNFNGAVAIASDRENDFDYGFALIG